MRSHHMNIHKAFILGAGLGTRLKPLTDVLPKPLVPVWNEPLVHHALRHCMQAGIDTFAINTHHLPDTWQTAFPHHSFDGAPIEFFHEPELLETGGGIKNIASFIGSDPILVFNGDIITDIDLTGLMEAHVQSGNIATLAVKSTGPNCNIAVEDQQVTDLRNLLDRHPGNHQFTGIYCISPEILDLIPAEQKISIIPAFIELAKCSQLGAFNVDSASWHDIGTIDTYRQIHQQHSDADSSSNFIDPTATVAPTAKLRNSILWPNTTVTSDAELSNCIVFSDTPIAGKFANELL